MSAALKLDPADEFVPDVDFVPRTHAERVAYVKAHRKIPPALLTERSTPWLVAPVVFPIIERNSRGKLGWCNATEYTLRLWAYEQSGHVYGERSISRRLRQAKRDGHLYRKQIPAGGVFSKTGRGTKNGTTINRFPSEAERRARLAQAKHARRRQRKAAKARQRAERLIARSSTPPAPLLKPRRDMPRTGIVEASRALEDVLRPAYTPPDFGASAIDFDRFSEEESARREAEIARQTAAARALAAEWEAAERAPPE